MGVREYGWCPAFGLSPDLWPGGIILSLSLPFSFLVIFSLLYGSFSPVTLRKTNIVMDIVG
jgi:hypothetical protein